MKEAIKRALRGQGVENFSAKDVNEQAILAIYEKLGLDPKTATARSIYYRKNEVFEIISELIDEALPKDVQSILGAFAEVKDFPRNAEVQFEIKGYGKKRARLTIQKGARGGIYRAARLDNKFMGVDVQTWTVGLYVSLEDILLGTITLGELYQNILVGFEQKIYEETVAALRTAKTLAPASHVFSGGGLDTDDLDEAIRIAGAYGDNVVIVGFRSFLSKITNVVDLPAVNTPNLPAGDLDDIRNTGVVRVYKGVPVLELPNFIHSDGAVAVWTFKESDLFVLPGASKPIKIAMKGDMHVEDAKQPSGSEQWNAHKLMGIGLLLADNVCVITDATAFAGDDGKY